MILRVSSNPNMGIKILWSMIVITIKFNYVVKIYIPTFSKIKLNI